MKKSMWILLSLVFAAATAFSPGATRTIRGKVTSAADGTAITGATIILKGTRTGAVSQGDGTYQLTVPAEGGTLIFSFIGYVSETVKLGKSDTVNVQMKQDVTQLNEVVVTGYGVERKRDMVGSATRSSRKVKAQQPEAVTVHSGYYDVKQAPADYETLPQNVNDESYKGVTENVFRDALKDPLSTFSIDVDAASYANVRRFINNGTRPPKDAVRIEEMINYFDYDYAQPRGDDPFAVHTEISVAPWNSQHRLVHIGLQGKTIATRDLPPSNMVFLIDVSGSMNDANKLPLLKSSLKMLVEQLREQDHVAIVVYAGAAGLVLEPTPGSDKKKIIEALDRLQAGGSTAGGAGIELAYAVAKQHFKAGGNNRVILATDGDFNVGESSDDAMERLIEAKRKDGIFLTVLGYGMGNYKDSKMEVLADKGNGNYAYIDQLTEARKVLVNEFGGTLFTIAKDVKLQLEFNPAKVSAYRLIGYENRVLQHEDFNNDRKDAGDMGSGHTVTALYEIIPVGVKSEFFNIDELKYQKTRVTPAAGESSELMTIKLRYKTPDGETSKLITHPLVESNTPLAKTSANFRWSASVAAFGMLLRESEYVGRFSYDQVVQMAEGAKGEDKEGYRVEFINMVKSFGMLASK